MKNLFALLTLLTIFLFGCQSESPVEPLQTNDITADVSTLQKPAPLFEVFKGLTSANFWVGGYGGAKSYIVDYRHASNTAYFGDYEENTWTWGPIRGKNIMAPTLENVFTVDDDVYQFRLRCFNGKGDVIYQTTRTGLGSQF